MKWQRNRADPNCGYKANQSESPKPLSNSNRFETEENHAG